MSRRRRALPLIVLLFASAAGQQQPSGVWSRVAGSFGANRWMVADETSGPQQRAGHLLPGRDNRPGPSGAPRLSAGEDSLEAGGATQGAQHAHLHGGSTESGLQPRLPRSSRRRRRSTGSEPIDVPLTPLGQRLRNGTIVFRGLNNVCSNTDDWRHWLPVYLYRFTGARVVVWNTLDSFNCRQCPRIASFGRTAPCQRFLRGVEADMLVVVGAGKMAKKFNETKCRVPETLETSALAGALAECQQKFRYVARSIKQPWIVPGTVKVHFPISTLPALNEHNVFGFQHIIGDTSFLKPIGLSAARTLKRCISRRKQRTLMYIARYRPSKGLVAFLKGIEPEVLSGYTLHVYGDVDAPRVKAAAQAVARAKKLPVVFHQQVSKAQLLNSMCHTSGIVHYAERDKNPRVAYEGLYAGAPVFITDSSGVPEEFYQLPFVKVTRFRDYDVLNRDFQDFLKLTRSSRELAQDLTSFLGGPLNPTRVYQGICQDMGICL